MVLGYKGGEGGCSMITATADKLASKSRKITKNSKKIGMEG
jgi:hypothetical protein